MIRKRRWIPDELIRLLNSCDQYYASANNSLWWGEMRATVERFNNKQGSGFDASDAIFLFGEWKEKQEKQKEKETIDITRPMDVEKMRGRV